MYKTLTNKAAKGGKGSIVAIVAGTKAETVIQILSVQKPLNCLRKNGGVETAFKNVAEFVKMEYQCLFLSYNPLKNRADVTRKQLIMASLLIRLGYNNKYAGALSVESVIHYMVHQL